ncbi:MarR family transcriptional regulator [Tsukamurella paurometabola]|uniref:Homoprotocatechuate degradation operon regulator, HpaR n=1 Tax=Tsukamurella paurometabola TaxID=2061 RepID=A0A3P8MA07_TSUPA|nr:MarR family transcriptional regulator [Tsukamurella paurometabola]MBS4103258.1 MarR family transcriptional regulator [Tsukamurella paurometabola]UEA85029.1 MarR family transcriptional regulator [Tsukamurella paurometabola]VDR37630.1 homoprotocatechuate degradation operon regulator, HpaR [Tsukamurella paurometabola]
MYSSAVTDNDDRLAGDLALATVRFARHLRGRRRDSLVSLTQLSALNALANDGPLTPGQLAARERVQPPSMTRVIASLADLGLVRRAPHPTDGRQVIVSLSDEGEQVITGEARAREAWLRGKLDDLTSEQRATLDDAVGILNGLIAAEEKQA